MPAMNGTHHSGSFSFTIAQSGAVVVAQGDTIARYCAAMYQKPQEQTRVHWPEFGRIAPVAASPAPLTDFANITVGETLYHIDTYQDWQQRIQSALAAVPVFSRLVAFEKAFWTYFDLYLFEMRDGSFRLVLEMKLEFTFQDSGVNVWTAAEKQTFLQQWEIAIRNSWDNWLLKVLSGRRHVYLKLQFKYQTRGWEHWEVWVTKIPAGDFRVSRVNSTLANVTLDSEDLTPRDKKCPQNPQVGAVHEFGHMIGLPNEYDIGHPHEADCQSVMNRGTTVRGRHMVGLEQWLNTTLAKHNIR